MGFLEITNYTQNKLASLNENKPFRIMIFTEGTILGPKNIMQHFNHAAYMPIGNSVKLITAWKAQGAEILYITSRKKVKEVHKIKEILQNSSFPEGYLYYRDNGQKYSEIVELIQPNILVEDDCRSIGGKWQICITHVNADVRARIKSIVVKEFKGIDHLSETLSDLLNYD